MRDQLVQFHTFYWVSINLNPHFYEGIILQFFTLLWGNEPIDGSISI